MDRPPPPGVSTIGNDGSRRPVGVDAPQARAASAEKQPVRGRQQKRGEDVLANPEGGRRISSTLPTGVDGKSQDIIEMPMPKMQRAHRHTATFRSIDGNEYSFRTHDSKGKPLSYQREQCLFIALIEIAKGGNPLGVFDAYKLKMPDADNQAYYPIPDDIKERLGSVAWTPPPMGEDEEGEVAPFTIGE